MLKKILKYPLSYFTPEGGNSLEVPYSSRLLTIKAVDGQPVAYYEVDAEYVADQFTRSLYYLAVPTGYVFERGEKHKYYTTLEVGGLVVHFFINTNYLNDEEE